MKKLVNGKVVSIDNLELFKLGYEGLEIRNSCSSKITDTINDKSDEVREIIDAYYNAYRMLPFPLNATETELKYAVLANYIKFIREAEYTMWIDRVSNTNGLIGRALHICIGNNQYLRMAGNTWSIVSNIESKQDNTKIDKYAKCIGYNEYKWVYEQMCNGKDTKGFYREFMGEFFDACRNEPMVIKWELNRILSIGIVPSQFAQLKDNTIIYGDDEYILDIYKDGKKVLRNSNSDTLIIDLINNCEREVVKEVDKYDFNVYKRKNGQTNGIGNDKLEKVDMTAMCALFERVMAKAKTSESGDGVYYTGLISDRLKGIGVFVFEVNGSIYITTPNKYNKALNIANNATLLGVDNGKVYFKKEVRKESRVYEISTYCFNTYTGVTKLCEIKFKA